VVARRHAQLDGQWRVVFPLLAGARERGAQSLGVRAKASAGRLLRGLAGCEHRASFEIGEHEPHQLVERLDHAFAERGGAWKRGRRVRIEGGIQLCHRADALQIALVVLQDVRHAGQAARLLLQVGLQVL
jgi:hypothetical protein